jgi:hypothetical protein
MIPAPFFWEKQNNKIEVKRQIEKINVSWDY